MTNRVPRPRLRGARLRLGWSRERAADEISRRYPHLAIDARQIGRWESGETALPRPMNVLALCRTYGLPPEELDLPPIPGADLTSDIPGLTGQAERRPASPPPAPRDRRVVVQAIAADGDFITLVVNRQELADALGGTVTTGRLDDVDSEGQTHPCAAEHLALADRISRSIDGSWALFHMGETQQMLALARAQVSRLRRQSGELDHSLFPVLCSAAYRLLGATYHRAGCYEQALRAHETAHLAAQEAGHAWSTAATRIWQAYGMQALGRYAASLQVMEGALQLISNQDDPESTRLTARILASAATTAANLQEGDRAMSLLHASQALLDELPARHEEFDRAAWLAEAGTCSLLLDPSDRATTLLQQAVNDTPPEWVARHALTAVALAGALIRSRDRDAALAVTRGVIPGLRMMRSRELTDHFIRFLRIGLLPAFPGDRECAALFHEAEETFLAPS
jgi:tetratricopeptide (TPR) repeat protein